MDYKPKMISSGYKWVKQNMLHIIEFFFSFTAAEGQSQGLRHASQDCDH